MKKKYIIICAVIVVISSVILVLVSKRNTIATGKTSKAALYTIPASDKVFVNGVITPEESESIFLDSTKGNIYKIFVANGQVVKKGDTLFKYKNDQITDQIEEVNRQITSSTNQKNKLIQKIKQAADTSGTSGSDPIISGYQDQIDTLDIQISGYNDQLKPLKGKEYTVINSPISGKVILNDSVKDMTKAYIVIESTSYYIKGSVNEKDQPKIKVNQKADILVFSSNKTLTGKVTGIGNRPEDETLNAQASATVSGRNSSNISYYDVSIALDSKEAITDGFHVQATIKLQDSRIKIPKSSIFEKAGKKYVFKVVDGKLANQEITYKDSTSSDVVVTTGLKENDRIAKDTTGMKEGMIVE